jgi:hypothetical protein
MLTTPAINLIHAIRRGTYPNSFQKASFTCGIPLPAASGQKEFKSQPASSDEATITAKLIHAKCEKAPAEGFL